VANNAAMQANKAASSQLEACLAEERQQAVADRQNLLSQITTLVNASGEAQDARLTAKINTVQANISSSTSKLEAANAKFAEGMDVWSQKEKLLVEEVLKSRETLKTKMKQDWTVSGQDHSILGLAGTDCVSHLGCQRSQHFYPDNYEICARRDCTNRRRSDARHGSSDASFG